MSTDYEGQTKAERRRYTRKIMNIKVQFRCLDKDYVSAPQSDLAEDLGAGGLAMLTNQTMPMDQLLMVTIQLPPSDDQAQNVINEASEVSVLSRVAWSKPNPDGGFVIGIQFLDLEPGERQVLKTFLIDYKLDQPDSELYT